MEKFSVSPTSDEVKSSVILQRAANADKTVVKNCVDTCGNLIWALAKKYIGSPEDVDLATQEIFSDIWKYAGHFDSAKYDETIFIVLIAYHRLIKRSREITGCSQSEIIGHCSDARQRRRVLRLDGTVVLASLAFNVEHRLRIRT